MKKVSLIFKILTWCVVITFTTTTIGLSAPASPTQSNEKANTQSVSPSSHLQQAMAEQYDAEEPATRLSTTDRRQQAVETRPVASLPRAHDVQQTPLAWQISIPKEYGDVTARWVGNGVQAVGSDGVVVDSEALPTADCQLPTVIIVQDAHCNYEAQLNIAKIIRHMSNNFGDNRPQTTDHSPGNVGAQHAAPGVLVGLEGAVGDIDTSTFRNYPDHNIRDAVCRYFVRKGKISGAEYASITGNGTVPYVGIEDEDLYMDNYKAFLSIVKYRRPLTKEVEKIEDVLEQLRTILYSPELQVFEEAYLDFREEKINFFDYAQILLENAQQTGIDLLDYPQVALFREVQELEDRIDFTKLPEEANGYLQQLRGKLQSAERKAQSKEEDRHALRAKRYAVDMPKNDELARLDRFTKQYNEGHIARYEFFTYIIEQGFKNNINLLAFTNLYTYSKYIEKYRRIDKGELRFERRKLEQKIKESLARGKAQSAERKADRHALRAMRSAKEDTVLELLTLSERLHFIRNLINIRIFNQDMEDFEKERYSFRAKEYVDFILEVASRHRIEYTISLDIAYLDRIIPHVYDFYAASRKRDKLLVDNLLIQAYNSFEIDRNMFPAGTKFVEINSASTATNFTSEASEFQQISTNFPATNTAIAVLVAGGFHTRGVREELESRGISYVVIAPRISKKQADQEAVYLSRMLGEIDAFDAFALDIIGTRPSEHLAVSDYPIKHSFYVELFMSTIKEISSFGEGFGSRVAHDVLEVQGAVLYFYERLNRIYQEAPEQDRDRALQQAIDELNKEIRIATKTMRLGSFAIRAFSQTDKGGVLDISYSDRAFEFKVEEVPAAVAVGTDITLEVDRAPDQASFTLSGKAVNLTITPKGAVIDIAQRKAERDEKINNKINALKKSIAELSELIGKVGDTGGIADQALQQGLGKASEALDRITKLVQQGEKDEVLELQREYLASVAAYLTAMTSYEVNGTRYNVLERMRTFNSLANRVSKEGERVSAETEDPLLKAFFAEEDAFNGEAAPNSSIFETGQINNYWSHTLAASQSLMLLSLGLLDDVTFDQQTKDQSARQKTLTQIRELLTLLDSFSENGLMSNFDQVAGVEGNLAELLHSRLVDTFSMRTFAELHAEGEARVYYEPTNGEGTIELHATETIAENLDHTHLYAMVLGLLYDVRKGAKTEEAVLAILSEVLARLKPTFKDTDDTFRLLTSLLQELSEDTRLALIRHLAQLDYKPATDTQIKSKVLATQLIGNTFFTFSADKQTQLYDILERLNDQVTGQASKTWTGGGFIYGSHVGVGALDKALRGYAQNIETQVKELEQISSFAHTLLGNDQIPPAVTQHTRAFVEGKITFAQLIDNLQTIAAADTTNTTVRAFLNEFLKTATSLRSDLETAEEGTYLSELQAIEKARDSDLARLEAASHAHEAVNERYYRGELQRIESTYQNSLQELNESLLTDTTLSTAIGALPFVVQEAFLYSSEDFRIREQALAFVQQFKSKTPTTDFPSIVASFITYLKRVADRFTDEGGRQTEGARQVSEVLDRSLQGFYSFIATTAAEDGYDAFIQRFEAIKAEQHELKRQRDHLTTDAAEQQLAAIGKQEKKLARQLKELTSDFITYSELADIMRDFNAGLSDILYTQEIGVLFTPHLQHLADSRTTPVLDKQELEEKIAEVDQKYHKGVHAQPFYDIHPVIDVFISTDHTPEQLSQFKITKNKDGVIEAVEDRQSDVTIRRSDLLGVTYYDDVMEYARRLRDDELLRFSTYLLGPEGEHTKEILRNYKPREMLNAVFLQCLNTEQIDAIDNLIRSGLGIIGKTEAEIRADREQATLYDVYLEILDTIKQQGAVLEELLQKRSALLNGRTYKELEEKAQARLDEIDATILKAARGDESIKDAYIHSYYETQVWNVIESEFKAQFNMQNMRGYRNPRSDPELHAIAREYTDRLKRGALLFTTEKLDSGEIEIRGKESVVNEVRTDIRKRVRQTTSFIDIRYTKTLLDLRMDKQRRADTIRQIILDDYGAVEGTELYNQLFSFLTGDMRVDGRSLQDDYAPIKKSQSGKQDINHEFMQAWERFGERSELLLALREHIRNARDKSKVGNIQELFTLLRERQKNQFKDIRLFKKPEVIYEYTQDTFLMEKNIIFNLTSFNLPADAALRLGQIESYYAMFRGSFVQEKTAGGKSIAFMFYAAAQLRLNLQQGDTTTSMMLVETLAAVEKYLKSSTNFKVMHRYIAAYLGFEFVNLSEIFDKRDWKALEVALQRTDVVFIIDPEQHGFSGLSILDLLVKNIDLVEKFRAKIGTIPIDEADRFLNLMTKYITSNPTGELFFDEKDIEFIQAIVSELDNYKERYNDFIIEKEENMSREQFEDLKKVKEKEARDKKDSKKNPGLHIFVSRDETGRLVAEISEKLIEKLKSKYKKKTLRRRVGKIFGKHEGLPAGALDSIAYGFVHKYGYRGGGDFTPGRGDVWTKEGGIKGGGESKARLSDNYVFAVLFRLGQEGLVDEYWGTDAKVNIHTGEVEREGKDGRIPLKRKKRAEVQETLQAVQAGMSAGDINELNKEIARLDQEINELKERYHMDYPLFSELIKSLTTDSVPGNFNFVHAEEYNKQNEYGLDIDEIRTRNLKKSEKGVIATDTDIVINMTDPTGEKDVAPSPLWIRYEVDESTEEAFLKVRTASGAVISQEQVGEAEFGFTDGWARVSLKKLVDNPGVELAPLANVFVWYDEADNKIHFRRKIRTAMGSGTYAVTTNVLFGSIARNEASAPTQLIRSRINDLPTFNREHAVQRLLRRMRAYMKEADQKSNGDAVKVLNEYMALVKAGTRAERIQLAREVLVPVILGMRDAGLMSLLMDENDEVYETVVTELEKEGYTQLEFGLNIYKAQQINDKLAEMNGDLERIETAFEVEERNAQEIVSRRLQEFFRKINNEATFSLIAKAVLWQRLSTEYTLSEFTRAFETVQQVEGRIVRTDETMQDELDVFRKELAALAERDYSTEKDSKQVLSELSTILRSAVPSTEEMERIAEAEEWERLEDLKTQGGGPYLFVIPTLTPPATINKIVEIAAETGDVPSAVVASAVENVKQGVDVNTVSFYATQIDTEPGQFLTHEQASDWIKKNLKAIRQKLKVSQQDEQKFFYATGTEDGGIVHAYVTVTADGVISDPVKLGYGAHILQTEQAGQYFIQLPVVSLINGTKRHINELPQQKDRIGRKDPLTGYVFTYADEGKVENTCAYVVEEDQIADDFSVIMETYDQSFFDTLAYSMAHIGSLSSRAFSQHSAQSIYQEVLRIFKDACDPAIGIEKLSVVDKILLNAAFETVHEVSAAILHRMSELFEHDHNTFSVRYRDQRPDGTYYTDDFQEKDAENKNIRHIMQRLGEQEKNPEASETSSMGVKDTIRVSGLEQAKNMSFGELKRSISMREKTVRTLEQAAEGKVVRFNSKHHDNIQITITQAEVAVANEIIALINEEIEIYKGYEKQLEQIKQRKKDRRVAEEVPAQGLFFTQSIPDLIKNLEYYAEWIITADRPSGEGVTTKFPTVAKVRQDVAKHSLQATSERIKREAASQEERVHHKRLVQKMNASIEKGDEAPVVAALRAIAGDKKLDEQEFDARAVAEQLNTAANASERAQILAEYGFSEDEIALIEGMLGSLDTVDRILADDQYINKYTGKVTTEGNVFFMLYESLSKYMLPAVVPVPGSEPPDDPLATIKMLANAMEVPWDDDEKPTVLMTLSQSLLSDTASVINFNTVAKNVNDLMLVTEALRNSGDGKVNIKDVYRIMTEDKERPLHTRLSEVLAQRQDRVQAHRFKEYQTQQAARYRARKEFADKRENRIKEILFRKQNKYRGVFWLNVQRVGAEILYKIGQQRRQLFSLERKMKNPSLQYLNKMAGAVSPAVGVGYTLNVFAAQNRQSYADMHKIRHVAQMIHEQPERFPDAHKWKMNELLTFHDRLTQINTMTGYADDEQNEAVIIDPPASLVDGIYKAIQRERAAARRASIWKYIKWANTAILVGGMIAYFFTPLGYIHIGGIIANLLSGTSWGAANLSAFEWRWIGFGITGVLGFILSRGHAKGAGQKIPGATKLVNTVKGFFRAGEKDQQKPEDTTINIKKNSRTNFALTYKRFVLSEFDALMKASNNSSLNSVLLIMQGRLAANRILYRHELLAARDIVHASQDWLNAKQEADKYPEESSKEWKDLEGEPQAKARTALDKLNTAESALLAALRSYDTTLADYWRLRNELDKNKPKDNILSALGQEGMLGDLLGSQLPGQDQSYPIPTVKRYTELVNEYKGSLTDETFLAILNLYLDDLIVEPRDILALNTFVTNPDLAQKYNQQQIPQAITIGKAYRNIEPRHSFIDAYIKAVQLFKFDDNDIATFLKFFNAELNAEQIKVIARLLYVFSEHLTHPDSLISLSQFIRIIFKKEADQKEYDINANIQSYFNQYPHQTIDAIRDSINTIRTYKDVEEKADEFQVSPFVILQLMDFSHDDEWKKEYDKVEQKVQAAAVPNYPDEEIQKALRTITIEHVPLQWINDYLENEDPVLFNKIVQHAIETSLKEKANEENWSLFAMRRNMAAHIIDSMDTMTGPVLLDLFRSKAKGTFDYELMAIILSLALPELGEIAVQHLIYIITNNPQLTLLQAVSLVRMRSELLKKAGLSDIGVDRTLIDELSKKRTQEPLTDEEQERLANEIAQRERLADLHRHLIAKATIRHLWDAIFNLQTDTSQLEPVRQSLDNSDLQKLVPQLLDFLGVQVPTNFKLPALVGNAPLAQMRNMFLISASLKGVVKEDKKDPTYYVVNDKTYENPYQSPASLMSAVEEVGAGAVVAEVKKIREAGLPNITKARFRRLLSLIAAPAQSNKEVQIREIEVGIMTLIIRMLLPFEDAIHIKPEDLLSVYDEIIEGKMNNKEFTQLLRDTGIIKEKPESVIAQFASKPTLPFNDKMRLARAYLEHGKFEDAQRAAELLIELFAEKVPVSEKQKLADLAIMLLTVNKELTTLEQDPSDSTYADQLKNNIRKRGEKYGLPQSLINNVVQHITSIQRQYWNDRINAQLSALQAIHKKLDALRLSMEMNTEVVSHQTFFNWLHEIQFSDLQNIQNRLEELRQQGTGYIQPQTVNKIHNALQGIYSMELAIYEKLILTEQMNIQFMSKESFERLVNIIFVHISPEQKNLNQTLQDILDKLLSLLEAPDSIKQKNVKEKKGFIRNKLKDIVFRKDIDHRARMHAWDKRKFTEIWHDNSLTTREAFEQLVNKQIIREGFYFSEGITKQGLTEMLPYITEVLLQEVQKNISPTFRLYLDLRVLRDVYAGDPGLAKKLLQEMNNLRKEINSRGNIAIVIQPLYDNTVPEPLRSDAESIFIDTKALELDQLKPSSLDAKENLLVFITSPEFSEYIRNAIKRSVAPVIIDPTAFIPDTRGNIVQMLTLDMVLARIVSFFAKHPDAMEYSADFIEYMEVSFHFDEPMYFEASDAVIKEIQKASFKIAA